MSKRLIRLAAMACGATGLLISIQSAVPSRAHAQAPAPPAPAATTGPTGERAIFGLELQGARIGGNYDYFTAHLREDLKGYLNHVTARHASERVWALYWAGKYSEPLGDCEYVLQRFPNHPRGLHLIGEIAKATNNVSLGIVAFENALKLYPQYAFTHAQYGHYLIGIGVAPAGVARLREALRLEPDQFQARAWLAQALAAHPELEQAGAGEAAPTPSSAPTRPNP